MAGDHPQQGSALLPVVALAMVVGATALTVAVLKTVDVNRTAQKTTLTRLERIAWALVTYGQMHQRLPCPADGSQAEDSGTFGAAVPTTASNDCPYETGIVPWRSLGLTEDQGYDGWGNRISYRVYDGADGLTRSSGIDMTACDTDEPTPVTLAFGGFCESTNHDNSTAQFLAGKGLAYQEQDSSGTILAQNDPTAGTGAAFVLISHGPSGEGAYLADGSRASVHTDHATEQDNTGDNTETFIRKPFRKVMAGESETLHFDDVMLAWSISDYVRRVGLAARNWPDDLPEATVALNMDFSILSFPTTGNSGNITGVTNSTTLTVGGISIKIEGSGNLSYYDNNFGVGVGNPSKGNIEAGETLRFIFPATFRSFSLTIDDLDNGETMAVKGELASSDTVTSGTEVSGSPLTLAGGSTSYPNQVFGASNRFSILELSAGDGSSYGLRGLTVHP